MDTENYDFPSVAFYPLLKKWDEIRGWPVYCRITYDRRKAEFKTLIHVKPSNKEKFERDYNHNDAQKKRKARNEWPRLLAKDEKQHLKSIEADILKVSQRLSQNEDITAKKIRDIYLNRTDTRAPSLVGYFVEYIDRISKREKEISPKAVNHYKQTLHHLRHFLDFNEKGDQIRLKSVDYGFLKDFQDYMLYQKWPLVDKQPMKKSTTARHLIKLKVVTGDAYKRRILADDPFRDFKIPRYKKSTTPFLDRHELEMIRDTELEQFSNLDIARDVFFFCCFTGLRPGDAIHLTTEHIQEREDGHLWFKTIQQKTDYQVWKPFTEVAEAIYKKYQPFRIGTSRIFAKEWKQPQVVNRQLKEVARRAGIEKNLSLKVGRMTFANVIANQGGVNLEKERLSEIQNELGHRSGGTTSYYYRLEDNIHLNVKQRIDEAFKGFYQDGNKN